MKRDPTISQKALRTWVDHALEEIEWWRTKPLPEELLWVVPEPDDGSWREEMELHCTQEDSEWEEGMSLPTLPRRQLRDLVSQEPAAEWTGLEPDVYDLLSAALEHRPLAGSEAPKELVVERHWQGCTLVNPLCPDDLCDLAPEEHSGAEHRLSTFSEPAEVSEVMFMATPGTRRNQLVRLGALRAIELWPDEHLAVPIARQADRMNGTLVTRHPRYGIPLGRASRFAHLPREVRAHWNSQRTSVTRYSATWWCGNLATDVALLEDLPEGKPVCERCLDKVVKRMTRQERARAMEARLWW